MNWKMDLLLELALARAEQPVAAATGQPSISNDATQNSGNIQRDVDDLVSIIYTHGRLQKSGSLRIDSRHQRSSDSDFDEDDLVATRLNARFWATIASICRDGDVPTDYRPPNVSLQTLSRHLMSSRQRAAIQGSSGTARYLSNPAMIFPRMAWVRIYFINEGREYRLEAEGYMFVGRQFIFLDRGGRPIYEHRISSKCKPLTRQRNVEGSQKSVVEFQEVQSISVLQPGGSAQELRALASGNGRMDSMLPNQLISQDDALRVHPMYWFPGKDHRDQYLQFQSDLRGLELLREFEISSLTSRHTSGGNDADRVHAKLWWDGKKPESAILSCLAQFSSREMIFEWPLRWFHHPLEKRQRELRLDFRTPPVESPRPPSSPGSATDSTTKGMLKRIVPRASRRSSSNGNITEYISGAASAASSIRSVDTIAGSHAYAPNEWRTRVEHLHFTLASRVERDDFAQEIVKLQSAIENQEEEMARLQRVQTASSFGPTQSIVSSSTSGTLPSLTFESFSGSPEISSHLSPSALQQSSTLDSEDLLRSLPGSSSHRPLSLRTKSVKEERPVAVLNGRQGAMGEDAGLVDEIGALATPATPALLFGRHSRRQNAEYQSQPITAARPRTWLGMRENG